MIKLSLVQFIRQFSFKKSLSEYNTLFLQLVAITLGSILVVLAAMIIYSKFFDRQMMWPYMSFWEKLNFMLYDLKGEFTAQRLALMLNFNLMLVAAIKLSKANRLPQGFMSNKMVESYAIGLLVTFLLLVFMGNGLTWLMVDETSLYDQRYFVRWLNSTLGYLLPAIAFFLAYFFLRRGMELGNEKKFWPAFLQIIFISLLILAFTKLLASLVSTIILQPIIHLLGLNYNLLSMVITGFIIVAIIVFYLVVVSDLLVILASQKNKTPVKAKTIFPNPELLDN